LISFRTGPAITVHLQLEGSNFIRASLSLSQQFQCEIMGHPDSGLKDALLAFLEYYSQKKIIPIDLPLEHFTPFQKSVLSHMQKVPFGQVMTYGELALTSGYPNAARAVGTVCRDNSFPLFIPCHRIIASGGRMGGFAYGLEMKKRLLDFESEVI
jgi:methylated-DNA-[protein]-cysteine S-methyltransferase